MMNKQIGVWETETEIIVTGQPDSEDENHNCEQMGCSEITHVLWRFEKKDSIQNKVIMNKENGRITWVCEFCDKTVYTPKNNTLAGKCQCGGMFESINMEADNENNPKISLQSV